VEPVVSRSWFAPGAHVSSVGGSGGHEIDAETVRDGLLFTEWPGAAASPPPAGAHELQGIDPARITLLGAVLDGAHPGRDRREALTVFKSTGHGALDVAAAAVALKSIQDGSG
jgi:ornithine cyclodeaminase